MIIGYRLYNEAASAEQVSATAKKLLEQLVKKYWSAAPPQVSVGHSDSGAPLLTVDGQPVYCSISHKQGCIAVAYSTASGIGIDLENMHTDKDYHRIRSYYQDGFLNGRAVTKSDFFHHWTLAEAYAKASGEPLLSVLERSIDQQKPSAIYFRLGPYLLCAYQASLSESTAEISLHQLDADNQ